MARRYTKRLSQKAVLEYLEDAYPGWKTFEQIFDELPIMRVDSIDLEIILDKLKSKGKLEVDEDDYSRCPREYRLAVRGKSDNI